MHPGYLSAACLRLSVRVVSGTFGLRSMVISRAPTSEQDVKAEAQSVPHALACLNLQNVQTFVAFESLSHFIL